MVNKVETNTVTHCDVVVVGAGLVGLAAVVALAELGEQVVLVDAKSNSSKPTKAWDTRIYALTPSTEHWLHRLGVWSAVDVSRVNQVEAMMLWHSDAAPPLNLQADDANLSKLACIIESKNLQQALWEKVDALGVSVLLGSQCASIDFTEDEVSLCLNNGKRISAKLVVAADGANSFVRKQLGVATKHKVFNQTALVANYKTEKKHGNVARQWFAPHETLALLPLPKQHVSIVWAMPSELAGDMLKLSGETFAERVHAQSRGTLGKLSAVSDTFAFELRQVTASKLIDERVVFIGDAAHQVHPMAGQGANLGFRDVIALQKQIAGKHQMQDIGDKVFLRRYERVRKADIAMMNTLTSGLDSWFSSESVSMKKLTKIGMQQLNQHASIKKILIKQAVA